MVERPRGGPENLGTDHIANAISDKGSGAYCGFLCSGSAVGPTETYRGSLTRMSSDIRGSQGDGQSTSGDLDGNEEDAGKEKASIASRRKPADEGPSHGNQRADYDQDVTEVAPFARDITNQKDRQGSDCTNRTS